MKIFIEEEVLPPNISSGNNDFDVKKNEETSSFTIPDNLKKTFYLSLSLFIIGLIMIIIGFFSQSKYFEPEKALPFWILGLIVIIPGGFYSFQFCKAITSQSEDKRLEILNQIPTF